ncbi:unnamed protein product [Closterium sp. NIES-54]
MAVASLALSDLGSSSSHLGDLLCAFPYYLAVLISTQARAPGAAAQALLAAILFLLFLNHSATAGFFPCHAFPHPAFAPFRAGFSGADPRSLPPLHDPRAPPLALHPPPYVVGTHTSVLVQASGRHPHARYVLLRPPDLPSTGVPHPWRFLAACHFHAASQVSAPRPCLLPRASAFRRVGLVPHHPSLNLLAFLLLAQWGNLLRVGSWDFCRPAQSGILHLRQFRRAACRLAHLSRLHFLPRHDAARVLPLTLPHGVIQSARYAALRGERVGDLPRSNVRLLRDGERSRREYIRCSRNSWRSMSPALLSFVRDSAPIAGYQEWRLSPGYCSLERAASPTVTRFLATAAPALVAELVDFAAACRLDYATSLVAESASVSVCPPSVGGECALGTDVLEDRQEEFECFAAAAPHLVSMLLAPEGDPDAPDIPTLCSYAKAIEGPYSSQWQAAMDAEMASWKSTCTYVDEVPPPGAKIVSGMWIFRVKRPPGSLPIFKARYVARGFSQRQGVDFFQTFSPTPKMTTLRVLLHVTAQRDYELHSLDFSTAFLQGSLQEEIWLRLPPGFTGSFPAGTQWSLRRPVYGLRQAPREWHDTLRTTLPALGFALSTADPSLFLRTDTTLPPFYVLVYVDDLVFATADTEALAHVKSELKKRHTCIDLGELTSYLGLRITRDRAQRTITLTQSHMVQQVLQRFGFMYSSPQSTPLPTGHSLSAPPSDESIEPSGPYPELVGCLMYLMTCTRPDLAYPLSILARYVAPGRHRKEHMDAAKRVLRYLCSTSGMGLVLGGQARVVLTGHADASWVDDLATQRSSQGYTFSRGSGSVSWRSTRSSSVLSSSCEAEIYAGAMAAQELRWLTYLLTDLGEAPRSPPVLYVDNKAMLALCQEHRLEHRTKHIALRYFLARELQQRGQLRLAYVAT